MNTSNKFLTVGIALALSACATPPPRGPSVMVLPGANKSFEQFQVDASVCHRYALDSVGITTAQAGQQSQTTNAVAGTVIGAMAGAALGAAAGDPGVGAAAGAGTGLLVGSAQGQADAYGAMSTAQDRYDIAYIQCMYAKGNQVPVPASARAAMTQYAPPPPNTAPVQQPGGAIPLPPAGTPPPPPSGAVQPYSGPAPTPP